MPIDITNKEEKQIALTGTQIEETLLQAHLSKDAIEKIKGLEVSASEIDGKIKSNNSLKIANSKILEINDLYTFSKDGFYKELTFPNPYPSEVNQPVHPSIVKSDSIFNGYKYWIAYTPYPLGQSKFENPCVIATNDFEEFAEPSLNPIVLAPSRGYNADTHLVFNDDYSRLYLLYRAREGGINKLNIMHTDDGKTWSNPFTVFTGTTLAKQDFASPSCWVDKDGKWNIIYHNLDADIPKPMYKVTSDTSDIYGSYSVPIAINIPLSPNEANQGWWHSYFEKVSDIQIIGLVQDNFASGGSGNLYFVQSFDNGLNFDLCDRKVTGRDGYYRSTFFRDLDSLMVFPSFSSGRITVYKSDLGFSSYDKELNNERDNYLQNPTYDFLNTLFIDTFNRVDSPTIGISDSGQSYVTTGSGYKIKSNKIYSLSDGARALVDVGVSNYKVQTKINMTEGVQQWVIVRYLNSSNFIRIGFNSGSNDSLGFALSYQEIVGGAGVLVSMNTKIKTNDVLSVDCRGNYIKVYIGNEVVYSYVTKTGFRQATTVGLQTNIGATSSFEDFIVTK